MPVSGACTTTLGGDGVGSCEIQAGFAVLVKAYMPAVLVEIGYGTNAADAAYMSDAARMDELAAAISDGVVEYLKRYERRVATDDGAAGGGGTRR